MSAASNREAIATEAIKAFGAQGGKSQRDWTHADWMEFLGGWQHARLGNCPGPDTKIRRLGMMIATLVEAK